VIRIIEDDLTGKSVISLLEEHFAAMLASSPPGSCHFLDIAGLKQPGVTFWSAWDGPLIAGMGALKIHPNGLGEIKSMRTHRDFLRQGVAARVLQHIIAVARAHRLRRLSLETGSSPPFNAAIALYERNGFVACAPFADYRDDPFSRYYTLEL
jgi:putative acetyltransferase